MKFSKIERDCEKKKNIEKIKMEEEFLIRDIIKACEGKRWLKNEAMWVKVG